jgi:hypothetical protein
VLEQVAYKQNTEGTQLRLVGRKSIQVMESTAQIDRPVRAAWESYRVHELDPFIHPSSPLIHQSNNPIRVPPFAFFAREGYSAVSLRYRSVGPKTPSLKILKMVKRSLAPA